MSTVLPPSIANRPSVIQTLSNSYHHTFLAKYKLPLISGLPANLAKAKHHKKTNYKDQLTFYRRCYTQGPLWWRWYCYMRRWTSWETVGPRVRWLAAGWCGYCWCWAPPRCSCNQKSRSHENLPTPYGCSWLCAKNDYYEIDSNCLYMI